VHSVILFCIGVSLGFLSTQHNKGHHEKVEIGFSPDMLGDIQENSIIPGDQIVKILHEAKAT